jgi:hypothetical protein|tara:strand:+ start:377 stop:568 length:192 start_codon:yes stop_codon:yes gene_type:complete
MNNEQTGVELARQLQWDGDALVEVMLAALTDANHHTLRQRLEDAYNHYLDEIHVWRTDVLHTN